MRKVTIKYLASGKETYADVLIQLLTGPMNNNNVTLAEMREVVPLIEKLEEIEMPEVGNLDFYFEDAEWKTICKRLEAPNAGFRQNKREALNMCEEILGAKEVSHSQLPKSEEETTSEGTPAESDQTKGEDTSQDESEDQAQTGG